MRTSRGSLTDGQAVVGDPHQARQPSQGVRDGNQIHAHARAAEVGVEVREPPQARQVAELQTSQVHHHLSDPVKAGRARQLQETAGQHIEVTDGLDDQDGGTRVDGQAEQFR